ncbi:putative serine-threonine rich [Phaeomoniella chlamydospora]|uniref:Putative serine-threonine rich n=1 Tax=Phaeomoniella chlamydospora TaxID=158046 RepID=A0A0G2E069_PHACM|nr:putative serine-threonine rich [Phaeomoniella chlamydospora]
MKHLKNIRLVLYHSIAARGEDVQEVLKKADGYESETDEDSESKAYNGNGGSTDNIEEGEIDDESPSQKNKDLSENSTSQMEAHLAEHDQKPHSKHGIRGETESLPQIPEAVVQNVTDEGLRNLMMAWYYAGYYTGLREGQQSAGSSLLAVAAFASNDSSSSDSSSDNSNSQSVNIDTTTIVTSSSSSSSETVSITIVGINQGGGSQTQWSNNSAATVHQVIVGGDAGLVYTPDSISAAVGDMVQFVFMAQNHTVTQSSFTSPCVSSKGLDSGFVANANNSISPAPYLVFQVQTADPIWMYCRQTGHCGQGMTFSINPTADKTQAAFKAAAIAQNGTATSSTTTAAAAAATSSVAAASASVVAGTGSTASGQCTCSCLCGTSAFASVEQGVGMSGGLAGSIAAAQVGVMGKRRAFDLIS